MIGMDGEGESGKPVLSVQLDEWKILKFSNLLASY